MTQMGDCRRLNPSQTSPSAPQGIPSGVFQRHTKSSSQLTALQREILQRIAAPAGSMLRPPRMLVVFAHPDDEVIALGARLERFTNARFLTLTDGAPPDGSDASHHGFQSLEQYRNARSAELGAALAHAGLPRTVAPLFASRVPDQAASLHLADLASALAAEIRAYAPEAVLTHPYEGGHPDHDACAFAVRSALYLGSEDAYDCTPLLLEAPFYHAGEDGSMRTGKFLFEADPGESIYCALSPQEQINKRARLACFASQQETLSQFISECECFRVAPEYNFAARPHRGPLLYERFPWGMTGDRFCALASEAHNSLFGKSGILSHPLPEPSAGK